MNTELSNIKNTFPKEEKLCSTKAIDKLFSSGQSFIAYPLRVVYTVENEPEVNHQLAAILTSVSKKKFKRAVKRNRVKRLIREAYRLNKHELSALLKEKGKRMDIAFLYLKNELPEYTEIEKAILKTVSVLISKLREGVPE
ncbi:ribonuclease P protein component [Prevotella sp. 10(H)]|uniref:ribonuclease P protein component n=1 Tax=Prevotella sp. 10(H) TaxID=1158294 RepID=UPI0004A77ED3|nr:ribonuclease P protein component [Prevotella sp. 10(H)]